MSQFISSGFDAVKKYTKKNKVQIQQLETLIIQVHSNFHWFSVAVRMTLKTIEIFDSLHSPTNLKSIEDIPISVQPIVAYTKQELNGMLDKEWTFCFAKCPQQPNAVDCGIHACLQSLCLALDIPLTYDPSTMDDFRIYIFNCILERCLIQRNVV